MCAASSHPALNHDNLPGDLLAALEQAKWYEA